MNGLESNTYIAPKMKSSKLVGYLSECNNLPILGHVIWWNIREVDITKDEFSSYLKVAGLSDKYAKSHNYRSALIRALRSMEEERIIRPVKEDATCVIFQFTAEKLVNDEQNPHLAYDAEVTVTVDKDAYATFQKDEDGFYKSISKVADPRNPDVDCADAENIKLTIAKAFEREKDAYKSSDITRYVQQIFQEKADIVSLRPQGSIYFVPACYDSIVQSVKQLIEQIGGSCSFEALPVPDTKDARKTIGDSFAEEVASLLTNMDEEIKKAQEGSKDITDKWVETRQERIKKVKDRIDMYADVLGVRADKLRGDFDALNDILKPRVLVLD